MNNKKISIVALVVVASMMSIQIATAQMQTPSNNYNQTMREEYDDVIQPDFNDNTHILNLFVTSCNNNYINAASNALQECYTILKEWNNFMHELRETHNATIQKHYEQGADSLMSDFGLY